MTLSQAMVHWHVVGRGGTMWHTLFDSALEAEAAVDFLWFSQPFGLYTEEKCNTAHWFPLLLAVLC